MHPLTLSTSPTPITRHEIAEELNALVVIELDAIAAYHAAIERIDDAVDAAQLAAFQKDHEGHLQDLSAAVERLGGRPRTHTDYLKISTEGRVVVGASGGDRPILEAIRGNARDAVAGYDAAVRRCGAASPGIKEMLARHLHDERRHRDWLDHRLTGARA